MSKHIIIDTPSDWVNCSIKSIIDDGNFDEFIESVGHDFICFVPIFGGGSTMLFKEKESDQ